MDEILSCSSCKTRFETTGLREPRMLRCQHTFCKVCTFEQVGPDGTYCPACNDTDYSQTSYDHDAIQVNYTIIRLLNVQEKDQKKGWIPWLISLTYNFVKVYLITVWFCAWTTLVNTPTADLRLRYESKLDFVLVITIKPLAYFLGIELPLGERF
uniref:uncharacterized protein LOC120334811 n=1 Tax=Styela clava TaxID=7725 RepID=UPI00193AA259|nr:uncharacterized protein LOC120334811 [Styela clava]